MHGSQVRIEFEKVLPRIQTHAEIVFRGVRCPHKRADFIAEAVVLAFKWWVRLRKKGKNPNRFVSAIATFAAKACAERSESLRSGESQ